MCCHCLVGTVSNLLGHVPGQVRWHSVGMGTTIPTCTINPQVLGIVAAQANLVFLHRFTKLHRTGVINAGVR